MLVPRLLPMQKKKETAGVARSSLAQSDHSLVPRLLPVFLREEEPGYEASLTTPGYKLNLHVEKFFVESL